MVHLSELVFFSALQLVSYRLSSITAILRLPYFEFLCLRSCLLPSSPPSWWLWGTGCQRLLTPSREAVRVRLRQLFRQELQGQDIFGFGFGFQFCFNNNLSWHFHNIKNPSAKMYKFGRVLWNIVLSWTLALKIQRHLFLPFLFPHFNNWSFLLRLSDFR